MAFTRPGKLSLSLTYLLAVFASFRVGPSIVHSQLLQDPGSISFTEPVPETRPVAPLTTDRYSGVPIATMELGYEIIRSRRKFAPKTGEIAPDFNLSAAAGDQRYRLYDLCREKPVVLIFASWGCDIFRETLSGWKEMYRKYHGQAEFVFVYIREAHPTDYSKPLGRAEDPKTLDQRKATALKCQKLLDLPFLMLVDEINDPCAVRWGAWPVRTFVIDTDLSVAYAGAQGPWGYRPYRGFVHGSGKQIEEDRGYDWQTLEEFLENKFPLPSASQGETSSETRTSR